MFNDQRWVHRALAFVLPRPLGLRHKGYFFWCGFVIAFPIYGAVQPALTSQIIGDALIRGLIYFFVLEILLQQAKFLWNDVRDHTRDRDAGINKERFQAGLFASTQGAILHVFIRWGTALVLGALLSPSFLIVLIAISLHQILYELVFKPLSGSHPIFYFVFLCFNLPLRVLGGYVCFFDLSTIAGLPMLVIVLFVFYLLSWSSLSNQAMSEAHRFAGDPDFIRYAYLRPHRWLSFGGMLRYWRTGDRRPVPELRLPRAYSFFFYENGRRMAALVLLPASAIALLLGWQSVPELRTGISPVFFAGILVVTIVLFPFTLRDVGVGRWKPVWKRVLRLASSLIFVIWIGTGVLTIATASFLAAAWFLIVYSFFHYLIYVDEPFI